MASRLATTGWQRGVEWVVSKGTDMQDAYALQISSQLAQIVAQLAAIREALEKFVALQDHPSYSQAKRY